MEYESRPSLTAPNNDDIPPNPGKKKIRLTSEVWEHFKRNIDDPKHTRAVCNYCGVSYAAEGKKHGTNNMRIHIDRCKKNPNRVARDQTTLSFKTTVDSSGDCATSIVASSFSTEQCRKMLARMIIVDELPFRFVENEGFRGYSHTIQPRFNIPGRRTVARDCFKLYLDEKKNMMRFLKKNCQKVCLTTDGWTSVQNINYMVVTAHFIDKDWMLHKRILSFCPIPNHKGETIGKMLERCLTEWGITKVFTVTMDNASSNDTAVAYLIKKIRNWNALVLNGDYLHVRCCAHILNLVVNDGLKEHHESISKIRCAVRYVRSSPQRLAQFKKCAEDENLSTKSLVCLDVSTRWNSTYLMLESALRYQKAFDRLEDEDPQFLLESNGDGRKNVPSYEDWEDARIFVRFLKVFYEATLRISGSLFVTSNKFFQEIVLIQEELHELCASEDLKLSEMAQRMMLKYDKYWGNKSKANYLLYVAVVLDPRYKLKFIDYCFNHLYGNELGGQMKDMVFITLKRLYEEYKGSCPKEKHMDIDQSTSLQHVSDMPQRKVNLFTRFKMSLHDEENIESKTEVDRYLLASCEPICDDFDILQWWNINSSKYRVLGLIARDVLAIPVSTVASESCFSTCGRVLDMYRSSLNPTTVEALICAQNWLRAPPPSVDLREMLDEIDDIEEDLASVSGGVSTSTVCD